MDEAKTKLKEEIEAEFRGAMKKCEMERDQATKELKENKALSERQEKLLASTIYEMGTIINKIMQEKSITGVDLLVALGQSKEKGSFIDAQINSRAQSNTKKSQ